METTPGERWAYSSDSSHLLSAIVADATGQSTLAFARAELFGPLGIATDDALEQKVRDWPPTRAELEAYDRATVAWPGDPQGYHYGGGFLKLPARDLAKLGYLYLNGGQWDGTQVVPADYVAASTRPQSDPSQGSGDYGYQWWVTDATGHDSFRAEGFGGQLIQVIPDLDLVVVITSDAGRGRTNAADLVGAVIVSAVTANSSRRCSMISIVVADGVVRERLPDETLLVFLSDTHIGGSSGSDIFDSAAELTMLLEDLHHHEGPVELVLAGDFLDVLRMEDAGGGDPVAATLARPEFRELFATLRAFAAADGHRVVYVVGNHDAELWWNPGARRPLHQAGLVEAFALSYAAAFASLPDQLVYCEHGNQLDPASAITDYANPLDTPVSAHVLAEMIRPVGAGAVAIGGIDLREVRYVFPLAAHPGPAEWIAGRIFYRFFDQLLRWLLAVVALLVVGYLAYGGLAVVLGRAGGGLRVLGSVLGEVAYGLVVLVSALVVVFLVGRRTTEHAAATLGSRFPSQASGRSWDEQAIRRLLEAGRPPPMAGNPSGPAPTVFVSGHTHAPVLSELAAADGRRTVLANTGCWLRQLQPVPAWLGGPPVFVPAYVHTHVRVRSSPGGVSVELWEHPRPAERRLPWIERAAIAGRMPPQPPAAGPRLLARQVATRPAPRPS